MTRSSIIIGAGIGGLTAALALRHKGIDVRVFERSSQLREVGAGIQMSANAVKVLRALGLGQALDKVAFEPEALTGWDWKTGDALYRTPLKGAHEALYGAPYLHVHRADLLALLAEAVGPGVIELGVACTDVDIGDEGSGRPSGVTLSHGRKAEADVVIGADGIHSRVRASLFGDDAPRFTGHMCWRGMVPAESLPPGLVPPTGSNWLGPHGHVVHYYVRKGRLVNFVAILETDQWLDESWTIPSSVDELTAAFIGWHERLLMLLRGAQDLNKWGLFDRDPLAQWTRGCVTLMGDAAHPMLPFLAQGAAQAIEDGWVLANCMADRKADSKAGMQASLQRYEALRKPRTAAVQLAARARGKSLHLASAEGRAQRDNEFKRIQASDQTKTTFGAEWIYGHDVLSEGAGS